MNFAAFAALCVSPGAALSAAESFEAVEEGGSVPAYFRRFGPDKYNAAGALDRLRSVRFCIAHIRTITGDWETVNRAWK